MDQEPKNEAWKDAYPRQYDTYADMMKKDPKALRDGTAKADELAENPNLVVLWAGYGFSKDYNKPRGHTFAVEDIHATLRTGGPKGPKDGPMPSTCWTCKSPDVPRVMKEVGLDNYYKGKWASKGEHIVNPIGCANCHDSKTMNLKIIQPALVEHLIEWVKISIRYRIKRRELLHVLNVTLNTILKAQEKVNFPMG